jgi:hypothetical protein
MCWIRIIPRVEPLLVLAEGVKQWLPITLKKVCLSEKTRASTGFKN